MYRKEVLSETIFPDYSVSIALVLPEEIFCWVALNGLKKEAQI